MDQTFTFMRGDQQITIDLRPFTDNGGQLMGASALGDRAQTLLIEMAILKGEQKAGLSGLKRDLDAQAYSVLDEKAAKVKASRTSWVEAQDSYIYAKRVCDTIDAFYQVLKDSICPRLMMQEKIAASMTTGGSRLVDSPTPSHPTGAVS